MKARTLEGGEVELEQERVDSFKARLRGQLILPGEAGYDEARSVWNAMIDKRPALIVRCRGVSDVIAAVKLAREYNLLLSIKGGGHNIAGLATENGALMLDMSLMRGVWVDEEKGIACAQPGCLLGDVDSETQVHGLAAVLGFIFQTGAAGLTLGGGFGYLTRRWGWTADNVVGMDVVTGDARLVRASREENADLFWGLRGGGGNFGVVVGIDYKLYPVGSEVVGGVVAWPAAEASGVLELYRTLAEEAPVELTLALLMRPAPPAPWLPEKIHGKPIVAILACYSGDPEEGEKAVAPIKSFGNPVGDILVRRPYVQMQSLLDGTQPRGRRYYWKSEYLSHLHPDVCRTIMDHAARIPSRHSAVILFQIGGALNQMDDEHSPVGNRDARYVLTVAGSWERPKEDRRNIEWVRRAWNDMKAFSTGGTYVNFLTEEESDERTEAALGTAMNRLYEIKERWDPANRFRVNRNIRLEGSDANSEAERLWRKYLTTGEIEDERRQRRIFRLLPGSPRCKNCYAPFHGVGSALVRAIYGKEPSNLNPRMCNFCDRFAKEFRGGVEIELSLLFADVRGSTTLAESMSAMAYSKLINRFYKAATKVLINSDALIDKIIGDEVVAMFVPGFVGPDHARYAVNAARRIISETGHRSAAGPWIPLGAGVHTGTAFVGSVGSAEGTTDITVLGDAANTAARLASAAAQGEILVSDATYRAVHPDIEPLERRELSLKGKQQPVQVHVLSERGH